MLKKVATRSPGFNIIEEYTIDEANTTADAIKDKGNLASQNLHPGNVETPSLHCEATTSTGVKDQTAMLSKTDTQDLPKVDTYHAPTGDNRTSSPLQCVETRSDKKKPKCVHNQHQLRKRTMSLNRLPHNRSLYYMWKPEVRNPQLVCILNAQI